MLLKIELIWTKIIIYEVKLLYHIRHLVRVYIFIYIVAFSIAFHSFLFFKSIFNNFSSPELSLMFTLVEVLITILSVFASSLFPFFPFTSGGYFHLV